jgi:UDP-GlcNAc:undecaprenyl-phosphate GlcNAc-1-phosphate transferase
MYSLFLVVVVACSVCLILTPLCRNLFRRLDVVDRPDTMRKTHLCPVPRVGGIPIAVSYLVAFGVLFLTPLAGGSIARSGIHSAAQIGVAALVIFSTGLLDDLIGLKPWQKLLGQAVGAGAAVLLGVRILHIGGVPLPMWMGVPLTLVWLIGCANAFNLIDGVDGLAAGIGLFATMTMCISGLINGDYRLTLITAPLAAALLGFLRYNFNPASIFLGDCGSLSIGFLLGCFGVLYSQKAATALGLTAPLIALAIPLLDTGLSIVRRFLRHQPIFGADRGHIHDRLLGRGFTPRRVALIMYAACGLAAVLSVAQEVFHDHVGGLVILLFCLCVWMGVQHLGYVEFGTVSRLVLAGTFRRLLNAQLALDKFRAELGEARSMDECWRYICAAYPQFGFNAIRLRVGPSEYLDRVPGTSEGNGWSLHIALSDRDFVALSRDATSPAPPIVAPFADTLSSALRDKIPAWQATEAVWQ